jgi:hypothetical protein
MRCNLSQFHPSVCIHGLNALSGRILFKTTQEFLCLSIRSTYQLIVTPSTALPYQY